MRLSRISVLLALLAVPYPSGLSAPESRAPGPARPGNLGRSFSRLGNGVARYAAVPLFFEANQGQTDSRVRFLARSGGYTIFLTPAETVLVGAAPQEERRSFGKSRAASEPLPSDVLRMKLVGANPAPELSGIDELPGRVNYLIGNDRRGWHTGVPLYSRVRSEQVYPGVDLMFHGDLQQLEYDFVVSPGADPNQIVFRVTGAKRIELDRQGNLILHTASRQILMQKPVFYQPVGAERAPVEGSFQLRANQEVGFELAAYDRTRTLVIDPTITYATFLGGVGEDKGADVVLDSSAPGAPKLYVPGQTSDITTFPETNTFVPPSVKGGKSYIFLAKIDPTKTGAASLVYLTFLGGSKTLLSTACKSHHGHLALDSSQGASSIEPVLVGTTDCTDFPVTTGSITSGGDDDYVTRLMPSGAALDTSIFFGGNGLMAGPWVSVDASGNVILADGTTSTNLPTTAGAYMTKFNNGASGTFEDCFVARLSRPLVPGYVTYLNVGAGTTSTNTIGCGAIQGTSGLIGAGGDTFSSTAFVPAGGANGFQTAFKGTEDTFLMVLDPTKSGTGQLTYATYIGGGASTVPGYGALSLASGVVAVVGETTSSATVNPPDIPLKNAYQNTNLGASSAVQGTGFVTVVDTTKTGAASLICSSYFGGNSGFDLVQSVGFDPVAGNASSYRVVLGGQTSSTDFPILNPLQKSLVGTQNGFVSVLIVPSSSAGPAAALGFSTYIGGGVTSTVGGQNETIQGVVTDANHTIYARGRTLSDSFFGHTTSATTVNGFQTNCSSCSPTHPAPSNDVVVFAIPNPAQTQASSTSLASSLNPSTSGAAVTFTAAVKPATIGTPTGTVTFKDGTTTLGTGALSGGVAKFTISTLAVGTHSITAVYGGDATFLGSTSAVLSQVVNSSGGGGAVTFTPTSLTFTQQLVGAKSASKPVTLKNSGTGALTISTIVAVGNFSETNNCPASLAAGLTCTISVSFTPSITGKVLGEITVTDNAPGTTQEIGVSGNGVTPLNFSPTSLSFGTVTVGTTTAAKMVTVINNSTTLLTIKFAASGDYAIPAIGTTCGASLAAKAKCSLAVTFTPHYNGVTNGAITLTYNAGFSPVEVTLSGSGTGGAGAPLTFSPTSLSFANQLTGTTSAAKIVTVTNSSASSVTINSISASGDYSAVASGTTPCSNSLALAATHTCTFSVTFKPSVNGTIPGAVWIADSSPLSPQVLSVTGKGVVSVSLSPSSLNFGTVSVNTVSAAKTVTVTNSNQSIAVTITGIAVSGDYKVAAGTCTGSIAAKSKCTFSVSFAPTATGAINGVVSVSYGSSGSPQVVNLSGTGQ